MAPSSNLPGPDPVYAYMSTFHWQPLLNGYSGYYPRPHLQRLDVLTRFPDPRAIARLRADQSATSSCTRPGTTGRAQAPARRGAGGAGRNRSDGVARRVRRTATAGLSCSRYGGSAGFC